MLLLLFRFVRRLANDKFSCHRNTHWSSSERTIKVLIYQFSTVRFNARKRPNQNEQQTAQICFNEPRRLNHQTATRMRSRKKNQQFLSPNTKKGMFSYGTAITQCECWWNVRKPKRIGQRWCGCMQHKSKPIKLVWPTRGEPTKAGKRIDKKVKRNIILWSISSSWSSSLFVFVSPNKPKSS